MGIEAVAFSGIRPAMTVPSQLLRPISGEVDDQGRLLLADEAFVRLNERAGGEEGGILAVPALSKLALLSMKIQMRLSRAVRVADGTEDLELWVEVEPRERLAKISITSWRALPQNRKYESGVQREYSQPENLMTFDSSLRLVRASGEVAKGLVPADFGSVAQDVLVTLFIAGDALTTLIEAISKQISVTALTIMRQFDGHSFHVTGEAIEGISGHYQCKFQTVTLEMSGAERSTQLPIGPEAVFGKHLAPVLRQPLGRIIANAETIGSELQGPIRENYAVYARDIVNAARHLSALVDDLGDLEAVERPDFKTAQDEIELGDLARRVAGLLALKAADHSIRISLPSEAEKVAAVAEFRRTLQILLNLVNNAIRYSPDGTEVKIEICDEAEFAAISVIDQGKGIMPENYEKIFHKFERLGRSGDGGSGLGLYISRRLAHAMGGELNVGDAEGGGAIFTLRLPKM